MAFEIKKENGIATFKIHRPERKNAISTEVANGLELFLDEVEKDEEVAYVVVTGSEGAFCSGGDLAEYQSLWTAEDAFPMLSRMAELLYRLSTLPIPSIALINGTAVGGGCEIATACDYRVMSSEAKAGFIQGTLAITTGWGGATFLYEKGLQHDAYLKLLSEAKLQTASAMKKLGWATALYEGDAEEGLTKFLNDMAHIHPTVHRAYKKVAIRKWEASSLYDRVREEAEICSVLWESEAHHGAVAKFLEKKKG